MASYLDDPLSELLFIQLIQLLSSVTFSHLNKHQDASMLREKNFYESLGICSH